MQKDMDKIIIIIYINLMSFILQKHIMKQISIMTFALVLILCTVLLLIQSLRLLDLTLNHGINLRTLLTLTGLTIPKFFTFVAPIALFIAIIYCYYRLIDDQEITIMQAIGYKQSHIMRPAFYCSMMIMLLLYLCTLLINPLTDRHYRTHLLLARSQLVTNLLKAGQFTDINEHLTIYVREKLGDTGLRGIFIHDRRIPANPTTIVAEEGAIEDIDGEFRFIVKNGSQQVNRDGQFHFLTFEHYTVSIEKTQQSLDDYWFEPNERTTHELLFPNQNDPLYIQARGEYWKELHSRLSKPIFAFLAAMMAIWAISKTSYDRVSLSRYHIYIATLGLVFSQGILLILLSIITQTPILAPLIYIIPAILITSCLISINNIGRVKKNKRNHATKSYLSLPSTKAAS